MNNSDQTSDFTFYTSPDGNQKVAVIVERDTVWTTQKNMGELFGVVKSTISEHLTSIYESSELTKEATVRKIRTVQKEGNREVARSLEFYNLDAIISVGYRVNSYQATQFRIWATSVLKEYLTKGFALDDDRLKQGKTLFGKDYFAELIERIREIRASERRFYQKVTDIYAECSIDYDAKAPVSKAFFATVQNKLHFAITGKTAAELIQSRASSLKPNMGLQTWKNAPNGKVLKFDVVVAKNYMAETELKGLNRLVSMYLDYAENQAERNIAMKMQDWAKKLDAFLEFNEYDILHNQGKVEAKVAKSLAEKEFAKFRIKQDQEYQSDFDRIIGAIRTTGKLPTPTPKPPLSDFNSNIKQAIDNDPKEK